MRTPTRACIPALFCVLLVAVTLTAGCGGDSTTGPDTSGYRAVLDSGGDFPPVQTKDAETVTDTEEHTEPDGTRWRCTTRTVDRVTAPTEYRTLDPNAEVIYPGALIQGNSITNATPDPIAVKRAPGTVSIDLLNGSDNVAVTVPEVSQSAIRQALNDIIKNNNGIGAANFTYRSEYVQSREHLAAELGINVSTLTTNFDARMRFSKDESVSRWLVSLEQIYYTMSYDRPTSLDEVFASSVTPDDLARYVGPGNPACYISSVTYGRIFYLLVESHASREALQASVKASYEAAVAGGEIDGKATYVKDLQGTTIQVYALGGDPGKALATFNGDYGAVRDFLTSGGDIATGRPLSYTLRTVRDNKTVYVKVNNKFDVTECTPVVVQGPEPILWYDADDGVQTNGLLGAKAVRRWTDKFADETMDGVPATFKYCGWLHAGAANGRGDAVLFAPWQYGAESSSGALGVPGFRFQDTDFTLFAVVKNSVEPGKNEPVWFLWGSSTDPGRGMTLSFSDDSHIGFSTGGSRYLDAPLGDQSQFYYHLVTVRFSQTEGTSIYVNGVLAASDPTMTTPLTSFSGARLGAAKEGGWPDTVVNIFMATFKAYGAALTDEQRRAEESDIMGKYGL